MSLTSPLSGGGSTSTPFTSPAIPSAAPQSSRRYTKTTSSRAVKSRAILEFFNVLYGTIIFLSSSLNSIWPFSKFGEFRPAFALIRGCFPSSFTGRNWLPRGPMHVYSCSPMRSFSTLTTWRGFVPLPRYSIYIWDVINS